MYGDEASGSGSGSGAAVHYDYSNNNKSERSSNHNKPPMFNGDPCNTPFSQHKNFSK